MVVPCMGHHIFGKPVLVLASDPATSLVPSITPNAGAVFDCVESFTEIHVAFPQYAPGGIISETRASARVQAVTRERVVSTLCRYLQPGANKRGGEVIIEAWASGAVEQSHVVRVEPFQPG